MTGTGEQPKISPPAQLPSPRTFKGGGIADVTASTANPNTRRPSLLEIAEAAIGTVKEPGPSVQAPSSQISHREVANTATPSADPGPKRPTLLELAQHATGVVIPPGESGQLPPPPLPSLHSLDGGERLANGDRARPGTGASSPRRPSFIPLTPSEPASSVISGTYIMAGALPGETGRPRARPTGEPWVAAASSAPRKKSRYALFV